MTLIVNSDEKTIHTDPNDGSVNVKLSSKDGNGIYIGADNKIHFRPGPSGEGQLPPDTGEFHINYPGNMIDGTVGKGLYIIRCNKYVTRLSRVEGDINAPLASEIVAGILGEGG